MTKLEKQLEAALRDLFDSYKQLCDSGDCGNLKLESWPEGMKAIDALKAAEDKRAKK